MNTPTQLTEIQKDEAEFFDQSAYRRTKYGQIAFQADIRRATRVIPLKEGDEPVDPRMYDIQQKYYRERYLASCAHKPGGKVLDICCGPGWLALELGRRGQFVDAYDISPLAIETAKKMLAENPFTEGFGEVRYHLEDVSKVDLGTETLDAISGWSAFHHLPDFHEFMDKAYRALKPGGIIATLDDYEQGVLEKWLVRLSVLLLPTYRRSYACKCLHAWNRITGKTQASPEIFSPAEQAKYSTVHDIQHVWKTRFELIEEFPFNAFALNPTLWLKGPDAFRYPLAHTLNAVDRFLIRTHIALPQARILISRKPL